MAFQQDRLQIGCPQCREAFECAAWLVLDRKNQPDLVEAAKIGILNELVCPRCRHKISADTLPLLLYEQDSAIPLTFFPPMESHWSTVRSWAALTVDSVRASLGEAWDDTWLLCGARILSRASLASALTSTPDTTSRDDQGVVTARIMFDEAWARLSTEACAIAIARVVADGRTIPLLPGDVDDSFPEIASRMLEQGELDATQAKRLRDFIASFPDLKRALDRTKEYAKTERLAHTPTSVENTVADAARSVWGLSSDDEGASNRHDRLAENLLAFLRTRSAIATMRAVEHCPELLGERAREMLTQLADCLPFTTYLSLVQQRRAVLDRCREDGVEATLGEAAGLEVQQDPALARREELERLPPPQRAREIALCLLREQSIALYAHDLSDTLFDAIAQIGREAAQAGYSEKLELAKTMVDHLRIAPKADFRFVALERPKKVKLGAKLDEGVMEYLKADRWDKSQRVLKERPELLCREVEQYLAQWVKETDQQSSSCIAEHHILLRRCMEIGVEAAFQEKYNKHVPDGSGLTFQSRDMREAMKAFLEATLWSESRRILAEHPDLLTDEAESLFAELKGRQVEVEVENLDEHAAILQRCREIGIEAAFEEKLKPASTTPPGIPDCAQVLDAVGQLTSSRDGAGVREVLLTHPGILSDETLRAVEAAIVAEDDKRIRQLFGHARQVLIRCRNVGEAPLLAGPDTTGQEADEASEASTNQEVGVRDAGSDQQVTGSAHSPMSVGEALDVINNAMKLTSGARTPEEEKAILRVLDMAVLTTRKQCERDNLAVALHNVGNAYRYCRHGHPSERIEQGIRLLEESVAIWHSLGAGLDEAIVSNDLALLYMTRSAAPDTSDLPRAETLLREALAVFERQQNVDEWAQSMINLCSLYGLWEQRAPGNGVESQASVLRRLLNTPGIPDPSARYASALLAELYLEGRTEAADTPERIEEGIRLLTYALREEDKGSAWDVRLRAQYRALLGGAYLRRVAGNRKDNIEQAIAYMEDVVTATAWGEKTKWVTAMTNLASAYEERVAGDRARNIERAIAIHEQLLQRFPQSESSHLWAAIRQSAANAYLNRQEGVRSTNLVRALHLCEQALGMHAPDSSPIEYGAAMTLMAGIQGAMYGTEKDPDRLEVSIQSAVEALRVLTWNNHPRGWFGAVNNLARSLLARGGEVDLTRAVELCDWALATVGDRDAYTRTGLLRLASDVHEARGDADKAVAACRLALDAAALAGSLDLRRQLARRISRLSYKLGEWRRSLAACLYDLRLAEESLVQSIDEDKSGSSLAGIANLCELIVHLYTCLDDRDRFQRRIMTFSEQARARPFLRQIRLSGYSAPPLIPRTMTEREAGLLSEVNSCDLEIPTTNERLRLRELHRCRDKCHRELSILWSEMAKLGGAAQSYVSLRRGRAMRWPDIVAMVEQIGPQGGLVEFHVLADRVLACVMRGGWASPKVVSIGLSSDELVYRYVTPYVNEVQSRRRLTAAGRQPTHDWLELGEVLLAPLAPLLEGARFVCMVPHKLLHWLPLHALTVSGKPFVDRWATFYAPSAGVLASVLQRRIRGNEQVGGSVVMGYTPNIDPKEHAYLLGEAQAVAGICGCRALLGDDATVKNLGKLSQNADLVHLSCHGHTQQGDPLGWSAVLCGGLFTARDWLRLGLQAHLVTVSACKSGETWPDGAGSVSGAARALLCAGASSALLTLWSVPMASTKDWMVRFYEERSALVDSVCRQAEAFRRATLALREANADPYCWAPFMLMGDWS